MSYQIKIKGFKTKKQALAFLEWYEGGGEQQFYEHLLILDKNPDDGCNINVQYRNSKNKYYDETSDGYEAFVH